MKKSFLLFLSQKHLFNLLFRVLLQFLEGTDVEIVY